MMSVKLLKVAGIVLVIHWVIELLAMLSLVTGQPPPFVFQEIKENWQYAIFIGKREEVIKKEGNEHV